MQSFCPTTARKLKTVHEDFDAEAHYFHLKTQASEEEFGEFEKGRGFSLVLAFKTKWELPFMILFFFIFFLISSLHQPLAQRSGFCVPSV